MERYLKDDKLVCMINCGQWFGPIKDDDSLPLLSDIDIINN